MKALKTCVSQKGCQEWERVICCACSVIFEDTQSSSLPLWHILQDLRNTRFNSLQTFLPFIRNRLQHSRCPCTASIPVYDCSPWIPEPAVSQGKDRHVRAFSPPGLLLCCPCSCGLQQMQDNAAYFNSLLLQAQLNPITSPLLPDYTHTQDYCRSADGGESDNGWAQPKYFLLLLRIIYTSVCISSEFVPLELYLWEKVVCFSVPAPVSKVIYIRLNRWQWRERTRLSNKWKVLASGLHNTPSTGRLGNSLTGIPGSAQLARIYQRRF